MSFFDLEKKMQKFESYQKVYALPDMYLIAKINGRNFTKLTKDIYDFKAPYDKIFRDYMIETIKHLLNKDFNIIYAYTQSDEISLLFKFNSETFDRNLNDYNMNLSSEVSSKFSILLGGVATFECCMFQLPTVNHVYDYYNWKYEESQRKALNDYFYWALRNEDVSHKEAFEAKNSLSFSDKNKFLLDLGVDYNKVERWEKNGVAIFWESFKEDDAKNRLTGNLMVTPRKRVNVIYDLFDFNFKKKIIESILKKG